MKGVQERCNSLNFKHFSVFLCLQNCKLLLYPQFLPCSFPKRHNSIPISYINGLPCHMGGLLPFYLYKLAGRKQLSLGLLLLKRKEQIVVDKKTSKQQLLHF